MSGTLAQALAWVDRHKGDQPCRGARKRRANVVGEELQATLGAGTNPIQLRTTNRTVLIQTKGVRQRIADSRENTAPRPVKLLTANR
jgi:hypothetical protein